MVSFHQGQSEGRRFTWINFMTFVFNLHKSLDNFFPDDTSLFSTVHDITTSTLAVQWKMNFNHDFS